MLTGNKDVDRKILNELDDKDLVKACQVNKQADSICNDQVFWMNRVFDRFGYVGGDVLRKYKGHRSWSEYYIQDLRKINNKDLSDASSDGRLDHVIIALKKGADIHAHMDHALRAAVASNKLNILKFLVEQGADIHASDDKALINAAVGGYLEIFKYLLSKGNFNYDNSSLKLVRMIGHPNIKKYLESIE